MIAINPLLSERRGDTLLGEEAILEATPAGRTFPFQQEEMPFLFIAWNGPGQAHARKQGDHDDCR